MRPKSRSVVLFSRQMAVLLRNGVPLVQALETLSDQPEDEAFGVVVRECTRKISTGHTLSHSLAGYPNVFPKVFVSMAEIGERTGSLDHALEQLADWLERDQDVERRIVGALSYPLFVFCLACLIMLAIFYTVMPGFLGIFREMNIPLPLVTQLIVAVTEAVRSPAAWATAMVVLWLLRQSLRKATSTLAGRAQLYTLLLRLPLLGTMLAYGSTARFCCCGKVLLSCGMDVMQAYRLSAAASGSPVLQRDTPSLLAAIREGEMVSDHMGRHPEIYDPTLTNMVMAGEEASRIPEMMGYAGYYYNLGLTSCIDTLGAALEPLLMGGIAIMVGTIVMAVFLPMYSYIGQLGA